MRSKLFLTIAILLLVIIAGLLFYRDRTIETGWTSFFLGDPGRGGKLFFDKGCIFCHAISGTGGKIAPDLGKTPDIHLSLGQLVGVMWNHAPQMWQRMRDTRISFPKVREREMADIFAYLYTVRYLDEPGDPERGRELLTEKQCTQCHSLLGEGGTIAPDLRKWGASDRPILWAQAMWNHAPEMEKLMKEKGIYWPKFQGNEMLDLLYYIRSASHEPRRVVDLFPADPHIGRKLFSKKGCIRCHAIRGKGGQSGPDLGKRGLSPRTLTQIAGLMWNHSPEMWKAMKEAGVERPLFSEREMADLIAYLYAVCYFDEPGDRTAGERIFSSKGCRHCHTGGEGPDLSKWRGRISPITMACVMWNHGLTILRKMEEKRMEWPLFEGKEFVDLTEYLNTDGGEK